jgi:hypothetical protein
MGVEDPAGRGLDFLDPWGNHWQGSRVLGGTVHQSAGGPPGMNLGGLKKSEKALEELRRKGLAPE